MARRRLRMRSAALALAMLWALASAGGAAAAGDAACRFTYELRVRGQTVARLELSEEWTAPDRAVLRPVIANAGFTTLFTSRRAEMETAVRVASPALPERFRAREEKPDRAREIRIDYGPDGAIRSLVYRNRGRAVASEVPRGLWRETVDPLTAFVRLQRWVDSRPEPGARVVVPVFDGRKRLDIEAVFAAAEPREGAPLLWRLRVRLHGIVGFEDGYGFVGGTRGPARWLDVVVDDGRCPAPLLVVPADGGLDPAITRTRALRPPARRRRCPCPAGAAAAPRSRTSRGRCRSRRPAHP
ncbi:hypothetical protein HRbin39_01074 [bacterium HR39]|nr:hypothetical protein HRbin39_01074 [bacterium HR39]